MPMYEFLDVAADEVVEVFFAMKDAPALGAEIQHEGRTLQRLLSAHQANTDLVRDRFPVVSRSLCKNHPDCPHDRKGNAVIKNRQHRRELCAKYGYVSENE